MVLTIEACSKKEVKLIVDGINAYNLGQVPAISQVWTPLEFVAKNEKGELIGGVLAGIGYWNGLEVRVLWVMEGYRNQGVGSELLDHVEKVAAAKGATVSMLDTFDFQAKEFYLKKEYTIIGELTNFPAGHTRFYFSKSLPKQPLD